uniref:non-specific serine/threonine protein kinase n=1 Tax=Mesocestoides corti TaxID=53468 RepID=A0A5K3FLK3_MESCO
MNEMPGVDALMPPPLPATCASIAAKSAGSQTPLTNEGKFRVPLQRIPKLMALSPGRSIDSQLNELTKGLRRSEPDAISRPPSAQFDHISRLDDGKSEDSSVELNSLDRPPDPRYYAVDSAEMMVHSSQSFGSSVSGADHLKAGRQSPSGASPGGSVGGAGFFKHMLLRKNTSAGRTSASKPTSKLRKVRAGDNVMLARPELSATEVLERISESLRSNSIRFTLKRHGFTCTFSNDWGRTLLKFEIEVVNVVGKYSLPKLLINKKPIGVGAKLRAPLVAVASDNPTPSPADADDDGGAPSNRISSEDVANQPCTIGVKIKRLHGDSFTYASICRAVLNQANVKEAVCI